MATVKLSLSGLNAMDFIKALEKETEANAQGWWLNYISSDTYSAQLMVSIDACDTNHIIRLKTDGTWTLEAALKLET